ncbi:restriction endonuclease subunit S [Micromonospora aurantiaca (nom. illeg.)]|uniref:restriction endonuclease subunit S n=1 Tax=Micromonospora aurantiaca (nom. illeg.) TaxID=47850 RepID=UPI003402B03C
MTIPQPPTVFAIRGALLDRLDVNYSLARAASAGSVKRVPLGDLVAEIRYGSNTRATAEPSGTPIIRMGNLVDGALDLSDLKYVQVPPSEVERYKLFDGDILVNRTNTKELVGKSAVFSGDSTYVYASYLIRLRLDLSRAHPDFISGWLNSADARSQIDRVSRRIAGMTNINSQDILALRVPLLPLTLQESLAEELMSARQIYLRSMSHVAAVLSGVSGEVLRLVGMEELGPIRQLSYGVPLSVLMDGGRLDVRYNHPERVAAVEAVKAVPHAALGDLVNISSDRSDSGSALSLSNITSDTGQLRIEQSEDDPEGKGAITGALSFSEGDILYGRLRPELNKVWLADRPGRCSPEFRVLKVVPAVVDPEYLAAVLRTRLIVSQTRHATTGNTHPRIADPDLAAVVLPVPDPSIQRQVARFAQGQYSDASAMRRKAISRWEKAKEEFERSVMERVS